MPFRIRPSRYQHQDTKTRSTDPRSGVGGQGLEMRRLISAVLLLILAISSARAMEFMDPAQVKVGMKGVGKSVFKGTKIEEFQVEVLGVMKKAYLGHDLILVKCSGANLEHTGVIAGMSGSPVFIDGKLVGAVSMTYGFAKEPIAEITPIKAMLEVMRRPDLPDQGMMQGNSEFGMANAELPNNGFHPIPVPLTVSGFDTRLCSEFSAPFEKHGLKLMPGSAEVSGEDSAAAVQIEPGSAVGVSWIRGDMNGTAIGTVTWREGNRIVAFGHPMYLSGAIEMPMCGGVIHAVMPSLEFSFKLFSPTAPIGVVTQDRATGIAGTIGPKVAMIPVRVKVKSEQDTREFNYEILNNKTLTANLLPLVIINSLLHQQQQRNEVTIQAELTVKLKGYPEFKHQRWFTGPYAIMAGIEELAAPVEFLMSNDFERIAIENIALDLTITPGQELLTIHRVIADRERAKPGDKLHLTVFLDAYRGEERVEEMDVVIPKETPEGQLTVLVTTPDSALMYDLSEAGEYRRPRSVRQMLKFLEQIGPENQLVVQGYARRRGMVISGEKYPNLPPSMLRLLANSRETGTSSTTETSLLFEKRKTMDRIVAGGQVVWVSIER